MFIKAILALQMESLLKYIRNQIILTKEEEDFLLSKVFLRKYLKGQYIVQQGDICKYECFVLSGCTKMFYLDDDGNGRMGVVKEEDGIMERYVSRDMASSCNKSFNSCPALSDPALNRPSLCLRMQLPKQTNV